MKMKDSKSKEENRNQYKLPKGYWKNSGPKCFETKAGDHNGPGKRPAPLDNYTKKLCNTESV